MSDYIVNKIDEKTYQINDSQQDSMYLLIGTNKALLIDSGMDEEELMPILKGITNKPIEVIFTHGHLDHVGRGNEFQEVYMSKGDWLVYENNYKSAPHLFYKPLDLIHSLDFTEFFLGDRNISIISLAGHTPGSVILVDSKYHHVFTGDAIGSGCGVWMQVNFALGLDEYIQQLENAYQKLIDMGCTNEWIFFGGHNGQEYQSKISEFNRLDLQLIADMIELCKKLLKGTIPYQKSDCQSFLNQSMYAAYGKAEIIFTEPQIEAQAIDLDHAMHTMEDYLKQFDIQNSKINLKKVHTYAVMHTSKYIAERENCNIVDIRLAVLIGLLHDIGRFEQIRKFNNFEDSFIDHAQFGLQLLFEQGMIREFIQSKKYDSIIYEAIYNHSLYAIEKTSSKQSLLQSRIVRDSDKLDNFRVKNVESIQTLFDISETEFVKQNITESVIKGIQEHRLIVKEERKTSLDRWISYLAFVFDLNFNSSIRYLKEMNYINLNIDRFSYREQEKMELIRREIYHYLESRI